MSEALYRKYRPQEFKDVVGQDHIVDNLLAATKEGKVAHAYLFAGSRGIGKTSIARIFARALGTSSNDVYEMDAASSRGVDDVRELRDGVAVHPLESKYKVYIIDEVHMLTREAFNALLKTLEEPPQHALFILATTEKHKLPDTIVSRCQVFEFKRPTCTTLNKVVDKVAQEEGYIMEDGAGELVALLGDGSFRDTLGVLQQVLTASKGKKVSSEFVAEVTGAPNGKLVRDVVSGVLEKNAEQALVAVHTAREKHMDMKLLLSLVLAEFRAVLLLRHAPHMEKVLKEEFSEDSMEWFKEQKDAHINSGTLVRFLEVYEYLGVADVSGLPIELAIMDTAGKEE